MKVARLKLTSKLTRSSTSKLVEHRHIVRSYSRKGNSPSLGIHTKQWNGKLHGDCEEQPFIVCCSKRVIVSNIFKATFFKNFYGTSLHKPLTINMCKRDTSRDCHTKKFSFYKCYYSNLNKVPSFKC